MIFQIFAVEDLKANVIMTPFFMRSQGEALRAFTDLANNPDTMVGRHPSDFRLIRLGTFADDSGTIVQDERVSFGIASDFQSVKDVPLSLVGKSKGA